MTNHPSTNVDDHFGKDVEKDADRRVVAGETKGVLSDTQIVSIRVM